MAAGQKETQESRNIYAGFYSAETVDVSVSDHPVTLRGGIAKGIYIATDNTDVAVITPNIETITYTNLLAGFHPIPHKTVLNSGTTATGIISGTW